MESFKSIRGQKPHKSQASKPTIESITNPSSKVEIEYAVSKDEFVELTTNIRSVFFFPMPPGETHPQQAIQDPFKNLKDEEVIKARFLNNNLEESQLERHWSSSEERYFRCKINLADGRKVDLSDEGIYKKRNIGKEGLSDKLVAEIRNRVFLFRAERFNLGQSPIADNPILDESCSNLAQVMHFLQTNNPSRFRKLINLLSFVFPQIKDITVPPQGGNLAQIQIWLIDPDTERHDLAIPLSESGTGIGQALAMLYIIVNSNYSQCLLIDEPQSFLHPRAIRVLLEIFQKNGRHQYIITSHSPIVLSKNVSSLFHVSHNGIKSKVDQISGSEAKEIRLLLEDIGSKLSDVVGADRILWVEGSTEEECFRFLVQRLENNVMLGTEILGVRSTGELEGRHAESVYDIYTTLTQRKSIIPPAIGFIFDREGKTETQMNDLRRKSKGNVFFLPRRMYENYLIRPQAISNVVNRIQGFTETEITSDEIEKWIQDYDMSNTLIKGQKDKGKAFDDKWLSQIHGAELLKKLFNDLSETRVSYDKVLHGSLLTEEIATIEPDAFTELDELLRQIFRL